LPKSPLLNPEWLWISFNRMLGAVVEPVDLQAAARGQHLPPSAAVHKSTATIDLFRWRNGLVDGPTNAAQNAQAFYSGDGNSWLKVSLARSIQIGVGIPVKKSLTDVPSEEIVRLVELGNQEPVAYQLLREAWELERSNPRSVLAIAIAAAEIGVKGLFVTLAPKTPWLVKGHTPPLGKLLRKVLPARARFTHKTLKLPRDLIGLINKGNGYRNGLLHAGGRLPDWRELRAILRAVNNVLWICELYAGAEWAGRYISADTKRVWPNE
jgi:hypothetical protein